MDAGGAREFSRINLLKLNSKDQEIKSSKNYLHQNILNKIYVYFIVCKLRTKGYYKFSEVTKFVWKI